MKVTLPVIAVCSLLASATIAWAAGSCNTSHPANQSNAPGEGKASCNLYHNSQGVAYWEPDGCCCSEDFWGLPQVNCDQGGPNSACDNQVTAGTCQAPATNQNCVQGFKKYTLRSYETTGAVYSTQSSCESLGCKAVPRQDDAWTSWYEGTCPTAEATPANPVETVGP